jgi:hypothetical protein
MGREMPPYFRRWLLALVTIGAAVAAIHEFIGFLEASEKIQKYLREEIGLPLDESLLSKALAPVILLLLAAIL